jgi:hypothetical protein
MNSKESLINENTAPIRAITSSFGKRITRISHVQYYFNKKPYGNDFGPMEFKFSDDSCLILKIKGDGESIYALHKPLIANKGFVLENGSICDWRKVALNPEIAKLAINKKITYAEALIMENPKRTLIC